tara:strand:- start:233 stop:499 length:267 start_codon:yes stop_codon:yes gene_type:complete
MRKQSAKFIFLIIFLGCVLATSFSLFVSLIIPEGVVRDFFILSYPLGFDLPDWFDLGPLKFKAGFKFDISILSVLGIFISWYILRYFK